MTKQCGIVAAWAVLLYVLQTSFLPLIAYRGISPDLMLLLTVSFAFLHGARYGSLMGFCAGLLDDLATGTFFGINIFSRTIIGFVCGRFSDQVFREQLLLPIFAALMATAVNYFITAAFIFMLGYSFNILNHIQTYLPVALYYQLLFAYPVHVLTIKVDKYIRDQK